MKTTDNKYVPDAMGAAARLPKYMNPISGTIDKNGLHQQLATRARRHRMLLNEADEIRRSFFDPLGIDPEALLDDMEGERRRKTRRRI